MSTTSFLENELHKRLRSRMRPFQFLLRSRRNSIFSSLVSILFKITFLWAMLVSFSDFSALLTLISPSFVHLNKPIWLLLSLSAFYLLWWDLFITLRCWSPWATQAKQPNPSYSQQSTDVYDQPKEHYNILQEKCFRYKAPIYFFQQNDTFFSHLPSEGKKMLTGYLGKLGQCCIFWGSNVIENKKAKM